MPLIRPVPIDLDKSKWTWRFKAMMSLTRNWEIVDDYIMDCGEYGKFMIPGGFIFDGSSIPKLLRGFLSPV